MSSESYILMAVPIEETKRKKKKKTGKSIQVVKMGRC